MLRISEKLEVGQEYYIVNEAQPLKGTFKIVEIQDKSLILEDEKFDRRIEVLCTEDDDFKIFYSKTDYLEYKHFIDEKKKEIRYLRTFFGDIDCDMTYSQLYRYL